MCRSCKQLCNGVLNLNRCLIQVELCLVEKVEFPLDCTPDLFVENPRFFSRGKTGGLQNPRFFQKKIGGSDPDFRSLLEETRVKIIKNYLIQLN